MGKKISYKVGNWGDYNEALISRGNITVWMDEDALESWFDNADTGKRGRPKTYSDSCIELGLTLRSLFSFPLRSTQGFLEGMFEVMDVALPVPSYTQLSRRAAGLDVKFRLQKPGKTPTDLVVDSTGLKIYGEGEWKMRTHGKGKRRVWRKFHIAADPASGQILAMELTKSTVHDDSIMPKLMSKQKNVGNVYADGAYVSTTCFDSIVAAGGKARISLRTGTGLTNKDPTPGQQERNRLVMEIREAGGKVQWKKSSDYHVRSLAETQMYRFKTILGGKLSNRVFQNQVTEAKIKTLILNKMTQLGMPDSCKIQ